MMRQFELVERVKSYDPTADEAAINRAYEFAMSQHSSQLRASGDPYSSHPIEVANILTKYKMDVASIITALLHDVIEDTPVTVADITKIFGSEVSRLVDGVTKLSRIELQSDKSKQAENFRKLVLAMSEDIRVLLIKLADRLHNMRTLSYIQNSEKRRMIALETMEVYAPLAERIGISEIKDEQEDLAFAELHPDIRESLIARLNFLREKGDDLINYILEELRSLLNENGIIVATVSGREKTPYSIWRKMQLNNIAFEQLSDIMAFRVIVGSVEDCYRVLGIIHSNYTMVSNRFRDYISTPKPNGYQSLHTGVFGPKRHRIEIQIRTKDMHEVSELGVAAHWAYKQNIRPIDNNKQYRWLRELLDIIEHTSNPEEFFEHTKLEMFQDQVFCFTPKGDLIALPRGSCAVDFAYAVHSIIGDTCIGAKVNCRIMPLRTTLDNGDQIEIITSRTQTPNPTWERFVMTGRAKARIRRFIRTQQRSRYNDLGRDILNRVFKNVGYDFNDKILDSALKVFNITSVEDLIIAVGEGSITGHDVILAVYPKIFQHKKASNNDLTPKQVKIKIQNSKTSIRGLITDMVTHFAGCCHPLPGDCIVGIVTTGKCVTIHTTDCDNIKQFAKTPERCLSLGWNQTIDDSDLHIGRINLIVSDELENLGNLSVVITKNLGKIIDLKITNRNSEYYRMFIDIEVQDVRHLSNIIVALRATSLINSVERA
ncbi:MAG: bifunctional (p)ppGpp synthetase/guanosine-3',5'-bis(diphosphate) 3'-pyrophosphohydrolase [Rhodospirillaceae bacterium]|jgi:GTP pyrophosphokinase|nr:bifunctional (p)ppGpp synthetase/guanosine-3',5'-bis(diphosphate) 3'-pyrophosphohydrolase [Rhodospirillaceae bacterium]